MAEMRFSKSHEWIAVEKDTATVGITQYAAEQLGDVVFVELPEVGKKVSAGADIAVVESVKAASEIYAPVSGEVLQGNDAVKADPAKVNADPEGGGWFFRMKLSDPAEVAKLMTKDEYAKFLQTL